MHNSSILFLIGLCIVTFQQTLALRRIKRGSTATLNKTKPSNDILLDFRNISKDIKLGEQTFNTFDNNQKIKDHIDSSWDKRAVKAVEQAIKKAFLSFSHKPNEEDKEKNVESRYSPLPHAINNVHKKQRDSSPVGDKIPHKPSLDYTLDSHLNPEGFFGNLQHNGYQRAGDGSAEVRIKENGLQPMMGLQHEFDSYSIRQPNTKSIVNSLRRIDELSKESHSITNTNNVGDSHSEDNKTIEGNEGKRDDMSNSNKRNNNSNKSSRKIIENNTTDSLKHNNDLEDESKTKYNSNNNKNKGLTVENSSEHNSCIEQKLIEERSDMKKPSSVLLSLTHKSINDNKDQSKLQQQQQQQQQKMKHGNEISQEGSSQKQIHIKHTQLNKDPREQQQLQFVKQSNGKMIPMEHFLKFANMLLYKVGPDGPPIRAQGAQIAVNGDPTTSVISINPTIEGDKDAETIDYIYNPTSPVSSPLAPPLGVPMNRDFILHPFFLPSFSLAGPPQPFNVIEKALDILLANEDEGNEGMEIVCPIHHSKKKFSEGDEDSKSMNGIIQVCSCRLLKKNEKL